MENMIFFFLAILSSGYFICEVYRRYRYAKFGRPENRSDHPYERWAFFCTHVLLQKKIRDYPFFGLFHGFIVWGFFVLLLSSFDMAIAVLLHARIPLLGNNPGYLFSRDTFVALVIVGVIGSSLRRIVKKPKWLHNSPSVFVILILILIIVTTEILFYATQNALGENVFSRSAWFANIISRLLVNLNGNIGHTVAEIFWWVHFLAIFAFFFIIPRSKHLHLVFAPFNTYLHSQEHKGALTPIPLDGENEEVYGVNKLEDFTWKQLLDALSCAKCGRCSDLCPAQQSGELIKPKKINGRLRKHIEQKGPLLLKYRKWQSETAGKSGMAKRPWYENLSPMAISESERVILQKKMVGDIFEEEFIWGCTTCGGCVQACPVSIEHTAKIIDMRRYLVSGKRNIAPEIMQLFEGIENEGNPSGIRRNRNIDDAWTRELEIPTLAEKPDAEYLYFVGCSASYDASAQKAAIAFAKILKRTGVDFAILDEAWCCGEAARRLGNEHLFQTTAKKNIASWRAFGIKKIITTCSHCFNTLKNEYSQFGGNYEVIPHSAFLAMLLQNGQLTPVKGQNITVTYHDSCYLGRYNGFYAEPREILKAIPGVHFVEMAQTKERSFCCGAGGGRFWTRDSENKMSVNRAKEAVAAGANVVCTTCPYCLIVLKEGMQQIEYAQEIITMDIAEILESSLETKDEV